MQELLMPPRLCALQPTPVLEGRASRCHLRICRFPSSLPLSSSVSRCQNPRSHSHMPLPPPITRDPSQTQSQIFTLTSQFQNFRREVLQDRRYIHRRLGSDSDLRFGVLLEETVDTSYWELSSKFGQNRGRRGAGEASVFWYLCLTKKRTCRPAFELFVCSTFASVADFAFPPFAC